jgi:hypothetical protein
MERLPLAIQNTYSDLLARLQDDAVVDLGGRPVKRTRRGRDYWYVRTYVGDAERERYLGPDTDELRQRIDRLRDKQDGIKARQRGRRALVQMLKVRGVPQVDAASGKVMQALATSGVFRLRGVLVGTHAFRLYPLILGAPIREAHQSTEDIDIAQFHEIAIALDDRADPRIQDALATVGKLDPQGNRVNGHAVTRLARKSSSQAAHLRRRRMDFLPGAFRKRLWAMCLVVRKLAGQEFDINAIWHQPTGGTAASGARMHVVQNVASL